MIPTKNTAKKIVPSIDRPSYRDFGFNDKTGVKLKWENGIFIYPDPFEGDRVHSRCELPICKNRDLIELGSLYETQIGMCQVIKMELVGDFYQFWKFTVIDEDGNQEEDLDLWYFISIFW